MRGAVLILTLGLTCLAGYLWGTRRLGLSHAALRAAAAATLEAVGLGVLFLAGNLALSMLPVLAARAWTGWFVSIYGVDYVTITAVSLLQGLLFRWWRGRG
ncbi:MAG TPA: hypothetical protein VIE44_07305 [Methylomirabilota bacterium]